MFLRRIVEALRIQNWTAIAIEFVIVVIGVFIGTQVSNWNQQRIEKVETERMLVQLLPELELQIAFFDSAKSYYAIARRFADQALAGWKANDRMSDEQFVIAAYQASQIYGIGVNAENWTLTFGGEQLRNIEDPRVRRDLELVLTQDYSVVEISAVATPYRQQVRRVIPIHVQDNIRRECGDRTIDNSYLTMLPPTCPLKIPPDEASAIAAALRARPDLVEELNWHLAAVAVYLDNARLLEQPIRGLRRRIAKAE